MVPKPNAVNGGLRETMKNRRPTILLADDHAMVAAGLSKLLQEEFDLVGTVSDGRAAVSAAHEHHPDVVLLDISMPMMNGLEAARRIHMDSPACKLIFLTMHSDRTFVMEAFRAGASGYVLKGSAVSELSTAVHEVLNDRFYVTPLVGKIVPEEFIRNLERPRPALSGRQREVLQLVAEGHSAKQIAGILNISSKTVEFHKALIMKKLGLRSTAELVRYALQNRVISN